MRKSSLITCAAMALSTLVCGVGASQDSAAERATSVRQACAADVARFCANAKDLQSRVQCMNQHESQLSEPCKAARGTRAGAEGQVQIPSTQTPTTPTPSKGSAWGGAVGPLAHMEPDPQANYASITTRMANRSFPSLFDPWAIAENLRQSTGQTVPLSASEPEGVTLARHDLFFATFKRLGLKLAPGKEYLLLTPEFTPESIQVALSNRAKLLAANPNMLILTDVHYYAATNDYLPPDSPWWLHDNARRNTEYKTTRLDFSNSQMQDKVAALCAALLKTGVYDGCMMDWWHDDDPKGADRLSIIRKIRAAIGEQPLLIGNVNNRLPARTAQYLNGMFMEGMGSDFFPDWRTAASNLGWAETHLRKPSFTALEQWWKTGRGDLPLMRMVTTLSLVFSNGYVLFSDPNSLPTPDHLHDWYPFWDKSLGHPAGPLAVLNRPDLSGAYTRQYEKGEVVFNPPSNRPVTVSFPEPRRSAATNTVGRSFTVAGGDGDLFLKDSQGGR